jgi:hypothetical protein
MRVDESTHWASVGLENEKRVGAGGCRPLPPTALAREYHFSVAPGGRLGGLFSAC